jgi:hypothetical protein
MKFNLFWSNSFVFLFLMRRKDAAHSSQKLCRLTFRLYATYLETPTGGDGYVPLVGAAN